MNVLIESAELKKLLQAMDIVIGATPVAPPAADETTITVEKNQLRVRKRLPVEDSSRCKSCESHNQSTFNGEMALHFPGLDGIDKPIVWVFPKVSVCLDCGFSQFIVPERELNVLETGKPADDSVAA
jgi:hypothetical protein